MAYSAAGTQPGVSYNKASTPRLGTDNDEFMLRSELSALESRIVRHVEEVTSGSEATQNLLRRELQQEVERHAERHKMQLCKIEASCVELACRLNDAEQRWTAARQDTMSELTSLQGRFDAVNSKSMFDRMDDSDKRIQSSRQDLLAEVAKLRAEFTARSEDTANERRMEFRTRTEQLETRIEELGRNVAETAGFLSRLGSVEQQLAAARAHPSTATLDAKITTLTARVEAADVKCRDLEHQVENSAREQSLSERTTASGANTPTTPAIAVVVERLQTRLEETEKKLAAGGNQKKNATIGEVEELRTMVNDSRSHMEVLTNSFATERMEYHKLLAAVNSRQADEQASLAHVVGEMDAELRVELASRAQEIDAKLRAELKADIEKRTGEAIGSVKDKLHAGFQAVLTELMKNVRKLQSATGDAASLVPRINNIEHELRGTTRLVTSLANRALDESSTEASYTSAPTTDSLSASKVKNDMMGVIKTAIRGAFAQSKQPFDAPDGNALDVSKAPSLSTAEVSSEISNSMRALHDGSEASQASSSEHQHQITPKPDTAIPEDLLESLQGLAHAIDKTIYNNRSASPAIQPRTGLPMSVEGDVSASMRNLMRTPGGSATLRPGGGSATYAAGVGSAVVPHGHGGSATYAAGGAYKIFNAGAEEVRLSGEGGGSFVCPVANSDEIRLEGPGPRGRSVEPIKAVSQAAVHPPTTLGARRPNSVLAVPAEKVSLKRPSPGPRQIPQTDVRVTAAPGGFDATRPGSERLASRDRASGMSVEVSTLSHASGSPTPPVPGRQSPTLSYRPVLGTGHPPAAPTQVTRQGAQSPTHSRRNLQPYGKRVA